MSRAMMQNLKAEKDEEGRLARVNKIVSDIYKEAVNLAEKSSETSYNYEIPSKGMAAAEPWYRSQSKSDYLMQKKIYDARKAQGINLPPFSHRYIEGGTDPSHINNMKDILVGLQSLFPDCAVSHTLLCQAKDGKMYDISKLDDSVLPFLDRALDHSYIVIDWS
jgi:hypothetical protein